MRILLTGATGYIGSQLMNILLGEGHHVTALVRNRNRLQIPSHLQEQVTVIAGDLLDINSLKKIPKEIDAAYYLVHSMGESASGFSRQEENSAKNFVQAIKDTSCKQIIYLGGLSSGDHLSEHMASRQNVETVLREGSSSLTTLRAGIIIGSGSASFEIIRDLVEKLPVMVAPRWVYSRCQPIAISDVLYYLKEVLGNESCYGQTFDIGGPDQLTYYQMLMGFAKVRGYRRYIIPVPVLTPRLSSYWLIFITSTNLPLAQALVESLKIDAICEENAIQKTIPHSCLPYREALVNTLVGM